MFSLQDFIILEGLNMTRLHQKYALEVYKNSKKRTTTGGIVHDLKVQFTCI